MAHFTTTPIAQFTLIWSCVILTYLHFIQVPLNTTGTKDQMKYIMNKADSTVLVCSSKMLEANLTDILLDCPSLKLVVLMDIALTSPKVTVIAIERYSTIVETK